MSLLTIVQNVAAAVNTTIPTSVVGNSNADARQWLALAKIALRDVARRHDWRNLLVTHTFTTTATVVQAAGLPTDLDHLVPDAVLWNQTDSVPLTGPIPSNEWALLENSASGGSSGWWRLGENGMEVFPAPDAGKTFGIAYVTSGITTSGNTWVLDADEARITDGTSPGTYAGEELVEFNLTWRWLRAHGMDYAEEMASYEREVEKAAARDRGISVYVLERRGGDRYSWPGTITP